MVKKKNLIFPKNLWKYEYQEQSAEVEIIGADGSILVSNFISKNLQKKNKILGPWMCYQRMFKLSPVSGQKGQRITTWKNHSWFSKLFEGDSQGKFNFKYHGWLINFIFIFK